MRQVKKQILQLLSCLLLFILPVCAHAQVGSTTEQTGGSAIYVAGNPDMYPVEYYDEDKKCYVGILPEVFERITEEQGIEICYVSAGTKNQQQRLAKNNQVEIVSAYYKGDVTGVHDEYPLLSFEKDGKVYQVCVGFTEIADPGMVQMIQRELDSVDKGEWLAMTMAEVSESSNKQPGMWYLILLIGMAVLCMIFLLVLFRVRKKTTKAQKNAFIDPLTGIGNSAHFEYCYQNFITVNTYGLYYIAYVGQDFNQLEKYLGEDKANEIQRFGADILTTYAGDADFAARISDGVFALAFQAVSDEQALVRMGELISQLDGYADRFTNNYYVPFYAGLFPVASPAITCQMAIYNARQGYSYAALHKDRVCLCDNDFLNREATRAKLLKKLTQAVANDHFTLNMQFVVDAKTGRICGAEVLSRWNDPDEGMQSPGLYVEEMINAGIIDRLDFHILEKVCRKLESWRETPYEEISLSCNITRPTISSETFMDRFLEITSRYSFEHRRLVLEVTEDALADNPAMVFHNIVECRKRGFRMALDDMGSGYTSFKDLGDYPFDIVKIDREIVIQATTDKGRALLNGVVRLVHNLGMEVLCEGVETEEENEMIKATGCEYIQGFYYSRVIPEEYAIEYYRKRS